MSILTIRTSSDIVANLRFGKPAIDSPPLCGAGEAAGAAGLTGNPVTPADAIEYRGNSSLHRLWRSG
jgi:hypothetical protein